MDDPNSPNGADPKETDGWFGWQVGANRASHDALDAARVDPKFRGLEEDLVASPSSLTEAQFDRQIFEAQREGRVVTMVNGKWPSASELSEEPVQVETTPHGPSRERR